VKQNSSFVKMQYDWHTGTTRCWSSRSLGTTGCATVFKAKSAIIKWLQ